ncbi:hypothetical protein AYI68_g7579 [Smittium mucronatum]|uniref:Uncharacterized protein n=1 Tax=Smittium mucronatum TaxID=133383 RepID=A0A1R0GNA2_9FUNG|nr:hypothetical protein AYI68_g7579 [Smittium mucronatum]
MNPSSDIGKPTPINNKKRQVEHSQETVVKRESIGNVLIRSINLKHRNGSAYGHKDSPKRYSISSDSDEHRNASNNSQHTNDSQSTPTRKGNISPTSSVRSSKRLRKVESVNYRLSLRGTPNKPKGSKFDTQSAITFSDFDSDSSGQSSSKPQSQLLSQSQFQSKPHIFEDQVGDSLEQTEYFTDQRLKTCSSVLEKLSGNIPYTPQELSMTVSEYVWYRCQLQIKALRHDVHQLVEDFKMSANSIRDQIKKY